MKSVLTSIQPRWCELIANGSKTIEVRKTKPKLETPFKVYIYCTLPPKSEFFWHLDEEGKRTIGEYARELLKLPNGQIVYDYGMRVACEGEYTQDNFLCKKVIGEFVCDKIIQLSQLKGEGYYIPEAHFGFACMSVAESREYGQGKPLYAWHISNLVIYDKPKELSDFKTKRTIITLTTEYNIEGIVHYPKKEVIFDKLTRPPQSWCYVESEGDIQ